MSRKKLGADRIERPEWAQRIRLIRGKRTQAELAYLCGVSQMTISRWESGKDEPNPNDYATLCTLSSEEDDRRFFWEKSGYTIGEPMFYAYRPGLRRSRVPSFLRQLAGSPKDQDFGSEEPISTEIPFLPDPHLWGTNAAEDRNISLFAVLRELDSLGENLWAMRVSDNSMFPIIPKDSILIIDASKTELPELEGQIVALRDYEGVIAKRIQRDGDATLLLDAQGKPRILRTDQKVIGLVVSWIVIANAL